MGNCLGSVSAGFGPATTAPPSGKGVFDVRQLGLHLLNPGLAASASSAHFAASPIQTTYSTLHRTSSSTLLLGLFEGLVDETGAAAAALANSLLIQTHAQSVQRHGDESIEAVLRATLQALHRACLAAPGCGASAATLLAVDLAAGTCVVANVGHARALAAGVSGSFNAKRAQPAWLTALHTTDDPQERIRAARRGFTGLNASKTSSERVTRALGHAGGGQKDLEVAATFATLDPTQGHLVLASSAFWDLLGPSMVTLRAHVFGEFQATQKAAVEAAARAGAEAPSPAARGTLAAEHLIYFALETACKRLGSEIDGYDLMTVADLRRLPFTSTAEEGARQAVRSDVYGDLACVVLSLKWPNRAPVAQAVPTMFLRRGAAAEAPLAPLARFRWAQVRMVVEFHRVKRRELLAKWGKVVAAAAAAARERAKAASPSPAVKVRVRSGVGVGYMGAGVVGVEV